MKKLIFSYSLFIIALLGFKTPSIAQDYSPKEMAKHQEKVAKSAAKKSILLSLDTIFSSGNPYAILKSTKSNNYLMAKDYKLSTLSGIEVVDIVYACVTDNKCYYSFNFFETMQKAELQYDISVNIPKIIVENNLVNDSSLSETNKNRFIMKYPPTISTSQNGRVVRLENPNSPNISYETVDRNRNAMVQQFGTELKQDFVLIGTIKVSTSAAEGKIVKVIEFYHPTGIKIAQATQEKTASNNYQIITLKDNKLHTQTISFIGKESEDIAYYLCKIFYM
jgi:hypothetical protein